MTKNSCGIAVDFGTSYVRAALISGKDGTVSALAECPNRLNAFGADILARITACSESRSRMESVFDAAAASLSDVLASLCEKCGLSVFDAPLSVIAANTAHMYFLLREDPSCIVRPPYEIPVHAPGLISAGKHSLPLSGDVYFVPCAANYLGGDVLCSLLSSEEQDESPSPVSFPFALLDLGVNAELVIVSEDGTLFCGSCAAGSALAAEDCAFSPSELTKTIASLNRGGLVNRRGRLQKGADPRIREITREGFTRPQLMIEWDGKTLHQSEIALFMQSKASVATMFDYMLETAGLAEEDLQNVYLTGSLGCALDTDAACAVGLLPPLPSCRWTKQTGSVLRGAAGILSGLWTTENGIRHREQDLFRRIRYVQLKDVEDYVELMVPHLQLPPCSVL